MKIIALTILTLFSMGCDSDYDRCVKNNCSAMYQTCRNHGYDHDWCEGVVQRCKEQCTR